MKNALEYHYNLIVSDIHQKEKKYFFKYHNNNYCMVQCQDRINEMLDIYDLSNYLLNIGVYNHQIILNKNNNIVTYINNQPYVLMRIFDNFDQKISLTDVIAYNNKYIHYYNKLKVDDWKKLWEQKIDYLEYQINQLGKDYPHIRTSLSYFIGVSENAISLLSEIQRDEKMVVSHRRLKKDNTLFDLYNPLNFVLDSRVRDIADYFKDNIIAENVNAEIILSQCKGLNFSENEWKLFFVRMLFPTFYFDMYEKIIDKEKEDIEIFDIIKIIPTYEYIIKRIYEEMLLHFPMPDIEWLKKT